MRLMRAVGIRLLIIDEVHNLLGATARRQRELLNLLRFLGNELRIPLVCLGTRDAYLAIRSDDQLENRFHPLLLPRWEEGEELARLLASFETVLPLREPSQLAAAPLRELILRRSEGTIGEIALLLAEPPRRPCARGGTDHGRPHRADRLPGPERAPPPDRTGVALSAAPGLRRWPLHPKPRDYETLEAVRAPAGRGVRRPLRVFLPARARYPAPRPPGSVVSGARARRVTAPVRRHRRSGRVSGTDDLGDASGRGCSTSCASSRRLPRGRPNGNA